MIFISLLYSSASTHKSAGAIAVPPELPIAQASPPRQQPSGAVAPVQPAIINQMPTEHERQGIPTAVPVWTGKLAKSGSVVCSIQCMEGPRPQAGNANGASLFFCARCTVMKPGSLYDPPLKCLSNLN